MIQTDAAASLALLLATALDRIVQAGDAAARTARLEGSGTDARVTVDVTAFQAYRTETMRAGLGFFGLGGVRQDRRN